MFTQLNYLKKAAKWYFEQDAHNYEWTLWLNNEDERH